MLPESMPPLDPPELLLDPLPPPLELPLELELPEELPELLLPSSPVKPDASAAPPEEDDAVASPFAGPAAASPYWSPGGSGWGFRLQPTARARVAPQTASRLRTGERI
jgi:hypothetical protein